MDGDSDENHLVIYVVGTKGGFPALKDQPDTPLHNFTQSQINHSQIIFSHKGIFLVLWSRHDNAYFVGDDNAIPWNVRMDKCFSIKLIYVI